MKVEKSSQDNNKTILSRHQTPHINIALQSNIDLNIYKQT